MSCSQSQLYIFIYFIRDKGDFDIEPSSKEFNANGCQENCAPKCNFSFDNILNSENVNERGKIKK